MEIDRQQKSEPKFRGLPSQIHKTLIRSSCFQKGARNITVDVCGNLNDKIPDLQQQ